MAGVGGAAVPGRLSLAGTEARPTEIFSYKVALIQVIYFFLLWHTQVSAHKSTPAQVRPYDSFSCFYERNLVSAPMGAV